MNDNLQNDQRCGSHNHIKDLENGVIGRETCKKALLKIKNLLKLNKAGQIFLIKGPSNVGKSALVKGLLTGEFLSHSISSVELLSRKIGMAEAVTQAIRKSIKLKVKENIKVIEGEVTSLTSTKLGLKTLDMESTFEIGDKMQRQIQKEKIVVGDVIIIIKERGKIIKLGVSASKVDPDLLGDLSPVPCPEGEMFKAIEEIQNISIHDLDALNNKTYGYLGLYDGETGKIGHEVRNEVNEKIKKWILEGKVEVERGILHIDNIQMLDEDVLSFINKSSESSFCPIILLIANTENEKHSKSYEFLDSALVINLNQLLESEIREILICRSKLENINFEPVALDFLVEQAKSAGIAYAINLLSVCHVKASRHNLNSVSEDEVKKMAKIFLDKSRAYENY